MSKLAEMRALVPGDDLRCRTTPRAGRCRGRIPRRGRPEAARHRARSARRRVRADSRPGRRRRPSHTRPTTARRWTASPCVPPTATAARRIVGTIRMGAAPPAPLGRGEAMRIPTGGVLPDGADAVLPVEDATETAGEVLALTAPSARDCLTPRGDDMLAGDRVLEAGRRIGARRALGARHAGDRRGRSLPPPASRHRLDRRRAGRSAHDVRAPAKCATRTAGRSPAGCSRWAARWSICRAPVDEVDEIRARIADGLQVADAVVLTGGSSVGARDHVPAAIEGLGAPGVVVHGLRVKPGKPTVLAAVGTQPVIGLPGNPTSALTILDAIASSSDPRAHRRDGRPPRDGRRGRGRARSAADWAGRGTCRRRSTASPRDRSSFARRTPACWRGPTGTSSSGPASPRSSRVSPSTSFVTWARREASALPGWRSSPRCWPRGAPDRRSRRSPSRSGRCRRPRRSRTRSS